MKKHREGWGCVYMMRNLINGKRNVGYDSTGDPENHRWKHHKNTALKTSDRRPLYRALRKAYKRDKCWDGFEFSVIWRGPVELLREKEIYYIRKHRSFIDDLLGDRSYNLTKGGDGVAVPSKCTKNKISTTLKVYCASNVVKKQLSVQSKKAWLNPEMRAKQVEVNGRLLVTSKDRARHGQRIKRGMKKSGASKKFQ